MTKSEFLHNNQVQEFIQYLAGRWAEGNVFDTGKQKFSSLSNAFNRYNWSYKVLDEAIIKKAKKEGSSFTECSEVLDELEQIIRTAYKEKAINKDIKEDKLFLASRAILKWGGVLGSERWGNLAYLIKPNDKTRKYDNIYEMLDDVTMHWESLNENQTSTSSKIEFRSNAGFTKIYSLLLDDFVIYDSRVAAALAFFLIKKFGEDIDDSLRFRIPPSKLSSTDSIFKRNPNKEIFKYTISDNKSHFASNVKSSWLLNEVINQINKNQTEGKMISLREFEAALFMIGYDVSEGRKPTIAEYKSEKNK